MKLLDDVALFAAELNYFLVMATHGYRTPGVLMLAAIVITAGIGLGVAFLLVRDLFRIVIAKLTFKRSEIDKDSQGSDPNAS